MPRTYVDNAYNRSAGRVGLTVGSAVISRSSGGGGGGSASAGGYSSGGGGYNSGGGYSSGGGGNNSGGGYSSGGGGNTSASGYSSGSRYSFGDGYSSGQGYSSKSGGASSSGDCGTYVDNAYNRSVGRVGLELGSAVVSNSSRSSGASTGVSSSHGSSSSSRTYVDNSFNRREGRVGLPVGDAIVSRSSGGDSGVTARSSSGLSTSSTGRSSSSSKTYTDNAYNRSVGRVGLPLGSAITSRSTASGTSFSTSAATGSKTYVENDYNRRLGRVGLPLGSAFASIASRSIATPTGSRKRTYVDNAFNRRLGRVGKEIGTAVYSTNQSQRESHRQLLRPEVFRSLFDFDPEDPRIPSIYELLRHKKSQHLDDPNYVHDCEVAEGVLNRHDAALAQSQSAAKLKRPTWLYGGEVIDFPDLEIGDKLGSGGFGDVHVAVWKKQYQVVVKKLRVQRVHQKKKLEFEQEVRVFSKLKHPSIVEFYGACVETPNICIVTEFMAGGSLYDLLHVECRKITPTQKYTMSKDILKALRYIHENNVVHRDVKSMNILVCEDYNHCKLGDFGLALKEENESSASCADHSVVGTLRYNSPEMLQGERLNVKQLMSADVYAASLTINELFLEEVPFDGMNQHQVRRAVLAGERPEGTGEGGTVPSPLKRMLMKGMSGVNSDRPSAREMLTEFRLCIAHLTSS